MREVVFDTETTGLSPVQGDRLVEIGCVELFNRVETGRTYHCYVNPGRPMPSGAEAVHGLTDRFLSDKPSFTAICADFLDFIGDAPLVAHNASFDFAFINHELGLCGRDIVCMSRMVDTVALARQRFPGAKHSLDALCTRFGVDRSGRVKHGALIDAQLLAQVYVELTGGRQIGLGLVAERIEAPLETPGQLRPSGTIEGAVRTPRPHRASADELALHAEFIGRMRDPVWRKLGFLTTPEPALEPMPKAAAASY